MRKLTSFLFISIDGVVDAPHRFVRDDVFDDLLSLIGETIAEQDAVLLGRKMYEEWSVDWPDSKMEPFAPFINNTPKYVVSKTLRTTKWSNSSLISGDIGKEIAALKCQEGKTIGVHGSISLMQSLLLMGLLDELRFIVFPATAGQGRHLLAGSDQIQFELKSARSTPMGLHYLVYKPRM